MALDAVRSQVNEIVVNLMAFLRPTGTIVHLQVVL